MPNILKTVCDHLPKLTRLSYFYGQMLGPDDLRTEQAYFREKIKLHNRCLHGYGTVCGLGVAPALELHQCCKDANEIESQIESATHRRDQAPDPAEQAQYQAEIDRLQAELEAHYKSCAASHHPHGPRVRIDCGFALDCEGNELIVREPIEIDLWSALSHDERNRVGKGPAEIWVYLCYCEHKIDPTRPILPDACGSTPSCDHAKIRDGVRVRVSLKEPDRDERCDTCCEPCAHAHGHEHCLPLARIAWVFEHHLVRPRHVHNDVRRIAGRDVPTTITGISWVHDGRYRPDDADFVLGTFDRHHGIQVRFSRQVYRETLTRGVIDLWLIQGGSGRSGQIEHLNGAFVDLPNSDLVDGFKYRHTGRERLNEGDRVLIILRTDFILDQCCKPVDGNHVGGRVPLLPHCGGKHHPQRQPHPDHCRAGHYGPWTSGNGTPGGTFESWFYIAQ